MNEIIMFINLASILLMLLSVVYIILNRKNENIRTRSKTGIIIFALIMFIIDRAIFILSGVPFVEHMNASFIHYAGIVSNLMVLPLAAIALVILVYEF